MKFGRKIDEIPLIFLTLAVAATLAVCSPYYQYVNSDSFIPSLVSLYHWTPFYWQQDRYGMLIPLLLAPITNPLYNFLAHCWISVGFGISSFLVIARYTFGPRAPWVVIGMACAASFLCLAPTAYSTDCFAPASFYPSSLCLGLLALICIEHFLAPPRAGTRPRWFWLAAGLLMMGAANWINGAIGMLLIVLLVAEIVFQALFKAGYKALLKVSLFKLALATGGALAGYLLMRQNPFHDADAYRLLPILEWPSAWWSLLTNNDRNAASLWRIFPLVTAVLAAGLGLLTRQKPPQARVLVWLITVAFFYSIAVGCNRHSANNGFAQRYLQPSIFLCWTAFIGFALTWIQPLIAPKVQIWLSAAACILLILCVPIGLGGIAIPKKAVRAAFGEYLETIQTENCTLIAGDYWRVWPTLLLANSALYDRSPTAQPLSAIAVRSQYHWSKENHAQGTTKVCVLESNASESERFLGSFSVRNLRWLRKSGNISVFGM